MLQSPLAFILYLKLVVSDLGLTGCWEKLLMNRCLRGSLLQFSSFSISVTFYSNQLIPQSLKLPLLLCFSLEILDIRAIALAIVRA